MIVPAVILIVLGLVLIVVAVASWQERLPRNILAGVRTPSTMRSDQAFKVANKVAAPLTGVGGAGQRDAVRRGRGARRHCHVSIGSRGWDWCVTRRTSQLIRCSGRGDVQVSLTCLKSSL